MRTLLPSGNITLVVAADDFGGSPSINRAVAEAHDAGILTAASLMAGGDAFEEAVRLVADREGLSIGLHVTLCDGRSVLPYSRIPALVDRDGRFEKSPVKAWLKYAGSEILSQIEMEVEAQFDRVERAGIQPSHVDCHHHLHMKPTILEIVCRVASKRGTRWVRIPGESLWESVGWTALSRGAMPVLEWAVFGILGVMNAAAASKYGLHVAGRSYGLSHTGKVDEKYLLQTLGRMSCPLNEIFTHPDTSKGCGLRELHALTSLKVRDAILSHGITLAGYRDLSHALRGFDSSWERQ